ncbi:hypothetical protein WICPIJ_008403 [Wickerhamomyces pijperi]|uniref:Uncharacterized protein n=1 Tax=Wickerhamomyces pijperi TaxID=599730 RepID=A0A9P8PXB8_WICPI|nr:hypothetical protein WICPIJ_008403 [Wickerhamomyces pijperi]
MNSASIFSKFNLQKLNPPPTTKFLLLALTFTSLLLWYIKLQTYNQLIAEGQKDIDVQFIVVPLLQLIPNYTLSHPWTLITSIFIDTSFWRFCLSFGLLIISGRFIERSWSSVELLRFICIVCSITNLLTVLSVIVLNFTFGLEFFNIPIDGNLSLLVSFLVVFKQLIPEHSIILFKGTVHARVKHLPFATLSLITVGCLISGSAVVLLQSWLGFVVAWSYLRFYQSNVVDPLLPSNSVGIQRSQGDASETFALIHFFPALTHPVLSPLFTVVYDGLSSVGIVPQFNEQEVEQGNLIANRRLTGQAVSSRADADSRNAAERRRQVALKVLEERIGNTAASDSAASASAPVEDK